MRKIAAIGFTGTRLGMTVAQEAAVHRFVHEFAPVEVHHGQCQGADAQFHAICADEARAQGWPGIAVLHPPIDRRLVAICAATEDLAVMEEEPKPFLVRDEEIVLETQLLIAAPRAYSEELGSGTWATIRRARKHHRPVIIVWPDGTTKREENV